MWFASGDANRHGSPYFRLGALEPWHLRAEKKQGLAIEERLQRIKNTKFSPDPFLPFRRLRHEPLLFDVAICLSVFYV